MTSDRRYGKDQMESMMELVREAFPKEHGQVKKEKAAINVISTQLGKVNGLEVQRETISRE